MGEGRGEGSTPSPRTGGEGRGEGFSPFIRVLREIRGQFLALLLGWLALAGGAGAATLTVTSLADAGPGTLRDLIAQAQPNDTIDFAVTGTITLTSGELVIHTNLIQH